MKNISILFTVSVLSVFSCQKEEILEPESYIRFEGVQFELDKNAVYFYGQIDDSICIL